MSLGFSQCYTDSCLYIKTETDGKTLVGIYVDDVLATGTDVNKVNDLFVDMQVIELKDLGVVTKFLGIAFNYSAKTGWALDQENTIDEMLDKFGLKDSAAVRVPICGEDRDEEITLLPSGRSGSPQRPTVQTFQSLVGSLLWIARCTRPDIAFAVHRVTRRLHAPNEGDWRLAKKIAKYLKDTKGLKFIMHERKDAIKDDGVLVEAYSDADYAADKTDRKSVSGGVMMVAGMVVGWLCKKQKCVALSTMEAEFPGSILHVDNQAAIAQIKGEDASGRAKHIDVRFKFVKDLETKKMLKVQYCESKSMRADILTKTLPAPRLSQLRGLVMLSG
uniref:Reverse transcriptase Ty1/copia-type domain-containing protein n=1 Tax=Peronospora matthiolae TaxID=2874970 RepID=A0AAV1V6E9_9STRA